MVQKSGDNQLRLVVYPIIYKVSKTSKRWLLRISEASTVFHHHVSVLVKGGEVVSVKEKPRTRTEMASVDLSAISCPQVVWKYEWMAFIPPERICTPNVCNKNFPGRETNDCFFCET